MNRETKRMMQRQGQMEADGSPSTRRAPAPATRTPRQQKGGAPVRRRATPAQFVREVSLDGGHFCTPVTGEPSKAN